MAQSRDNLLPVSLRLGYKVSAECFLYIAFKIKELLQAYCQSRTDDCQIVQRAAKDGPWAGIYAGLAAVMGGEIDELAENI